MELVTPSIGLLFWTTIIFLSVLFVLSKFAWKPIVAALNEREKFIEEALNSAEKARAEMALLKANNEKLLQDARVERDRILKEAQTMAANLLAEAKERTTSETTKMIENASLQINNDKNAAIMELKNLVATTSIQIAEQIMRKNLVDTSAQKELIQEYMKESKFN